MENIRYRQGIDTDDCELLRAAMAELGFTLDEEQVRRFMAYRRLLLEWNEKMNLTSITDPREILLKHFADSATAAVYARGSALDVGTGAGFPGVPVKLLRPDIRLTLLDSLNKRVSFLKALDAELALGASCLHARAEDAARTNLREGFDTVFSRAVAALPVLAEYCLPFVKRGGVFIAMKGPDASEERLRAEPAIKLLGGEVSEIKRTKIPFCDIEHSLIIIGKIRQTPDKYPRHPKKIANAPL